jgi:NAD(P) transhydrogenase
MEANEYDLVVIGSGPAGQKGAICAAKMRKKVAIIDRKKTIGGVCVHTGTIPSKTLREAVLYLSGFRQRTFYGRATQGPHRDVGSNFSRAICHAPRSRSHQGAAPPQLRNYL